MAKFLRLPEKGGMKDWQTEGGWKGGGGERGGGYLAIKKADNIDRWMKQYLDQDNRGCKVDMAVGGKGPLYRW